MARRLAALCREVKTKRPRPHYVKQILTLYSRLLHWQVSLVSKKLLIAAIDFVNPAPLMWDFEHAPRKDALLEKYAILSSTPAECARRLRSGTADIGLLPVAAYAEMPGAVIVPRCAIASLDRVRSILLVVRHADGVSGVQRVALDTASLTSATYARDIIRQAMENGARVF